MQQGPIITTALNHEETRVVDAFKTLAAGQADQAIRMLDLKVEWRATAARDVERTKSFNLDGARRYIASMASAIAHRGYRLDVRRVERVTGGLKIFTAWTLPGAIAGEQCANLVRLQKGMVVAVVEQI